MLWLPITTVLVIVISKYLNIFQQTLSVHNTEKTCFFKSLFRKYCPCSLTDYKSMFQSKIFRITCHNIKYIDSFFNEYYKKLLPPYLQHHYCYFLHCINKFICIGSKNFDPQKNIKTAFGIELCKVVSFVIFLYNVPVVNIPAFKILCIHLGIMHTKFIFVYFLENF